MIERFMNNRFFRVAVFGDFMQDVYHIGEADRLSAEVPIPVVKVKELLICHGGAGNVAANLRNLSCDVVWFDGNEGTQPVKNRLMVGDHQVARWDFYDTCKPFELPNFTEKFDAIVIADYGKGAITKDLIGFIYKSVSCPIFVDTKRDPSIWSGVATVVFPNEKEFSQYY